MRYRGIINFDFTGAEPNEHTRLSLALSHDGWTHVETSAFVCETEDIADLWRGVAIVAKQADSVGVLSAFTFHIQSSEDFSQNIDLTSTLSPQNALRDILAKPFPGI